MADAKISALLSATTPLVGTEEVPLVQSGTTKKTTVSDLRSTLSTQTFSGDNSTTGFTLATSTTSNRIIVFVNGVFQVPASYTVSGTSLTFTSAPPTGTSNIQVLELS